MPCRHPVRFPSDFYNSQSTPQSQPFHDPSLNASPSRTAAEVNRLPVQGQYRRQPPNPRSHRGEPFCWEQSVYVPASSISSNGGFPSQSMPSTIAERPPYASWTLPSRILPFFQTKGGISAETKNDPPAIFVLCSKTPMHANVLSRRSKRAKRSSAKATCQNRITF